MKLFSLLLGAALVSGASAAACATCRVGAKTATCTSATVDLTCVALASTATTGAGNFLDKTTAAATPTCKACANANTKTCTSATVATACHTGAFFILTAGAAKTCTACGLRCATCTAAAAANCITCAAGSYGGSATGTGAACLACEPGNVAHLATPLTCTDANNALTCPAGSILSGHAQKSCVQCSAGTKTCTAKDALETKVSTLSVTCLPGFFKTAGATPTCATCGAPTGELATPDTCTDAAKATTCPVYNKLGLKSGSVRNVAAGVTTAAECIFCSNANTMTCTKGADDTKAKTVATKCAVGFYIKAATATATAVCTACANPTCAAGTVGKGSLVVGGTTHYGCDGTTTAAPTKTTGCEPCAAGAATCTAMAANVSPTAAKTCKTGFTLRAVGLATGTKCLATSFGDNVPECVADCANMDGKANTKACGCGKATYCTDGQTCTVDKTKIATVAGKCATAKAQPAKKSPASAMQASALLSAAALLVAMRQ